MPVRRAEGSDARLLTMNSLCRWEVGASFTSGHSIDVAAMSMILEGS